MESNAQTIMQALLYNLVFSGLTLEQMNKIPKWLLDNIDNNSGFITRYGLEREKAGHKKLSQ